MSKEQIRFEEALRKLESIVQKMESDLDDIDEYIRLYEDGKKLLESCQKKLREYEKKIEVLTREDGDLQVKDLAEDEEGTGSESDDISI